MKKWILLMIVIPSLLFAVKVQAEEDPENEPIKASPSHVREAPKRPSATAHIVVESQEILDTCDDDSLCVEGLLYNNSYKPAFNIKLRIDLGASKYIKPRTSIVVPVDEATMQPGDRQEFSIMIPRKVDYKENDEDKVIEVGKYNFQIVPLWKQENGKTSLSNAKQKRHR